MLGEDTGSVSRFVFPQFHDDADKLLRVIKAIRAAGIMEQWEGLAGLLESVRKFHERLVAAAAILHAPAADEARIALERHNRKKKR